MSLLGLGEFHAFGAAGRRFLYLVPSAAVFALDDAASALIDTLDGQRLSREDLLASVSSRFPDTALDETLAELEQCARCVTWPPRHHRPRPSFRHSRPFR